MTPDLQKSSMWKRISAAMFDMILVVILAVGVAYVMSLATGFDEHNRTMEAAFAAYEAEYGVTFQMTAEDYAAMSEAQHKRYDEAYAALIADKEAMYAYNMVVNLAMVISSLSILTAFLILEFFIPLKLGEGRTLGKKIFGICLMRVDGIRINAPLLFIRTVLGKYTLETMVPVLLLVMIFFNMVGIEGTVILGLIALLQVVLICATSTNSPIHDLLAKTVAVDYASQRIFASEAELIEYKQKLHAERAARGEY